MPTRTHYCLSCNEQLYIVVKDSAVCPDCGEEYRVERGKDDTRVYPRGESECVRKQRMRRVTSKAEQLAKARSR